MRQRLSEPGLEHRALEPEIMSAVRRVLDSGIYVLGPELESVEHELAEYLEVQNVIGVGSGTDALYIALKSLDVGVGDEIITTPFTFVATGQAIVRTGATPVFCDVCPETLCLDAERIREAIPKGELSTLRKELEPYYSSKK